MIRKRINSGGVDIRVLQDLDVLAVTHPSANYPYEPYCGVASLFNADLQPDKNRNDWTVDAELGFYALKYTPHETGPD
jgi:hypothetical protein